MYSEKTSRFSDSRAYEGFFFWFHVQAGTISLRVKASESRKKHIKSMIDSDYAERSTNAKVQIQTNIAKLFTYDINATI